MTRAIWAAFLWWALILAFVLASLSSSDAATTSGIEQAVRAEAVRAGISPELALAIMRVESGGRPYVIGGLGEIGLFQLRPEFHPSVTFNYIQNAKLAMEYLAKIKARHGGRYPNSWFVFYNTGPNKKLDNIRKTSYYKKVMRELASGSKSGCKD